MSNEEQKEPGWIANCSLLIHLFIICEDYLFIWGPKSKITNHFFF